ncbi:hypothetical protein [Leptospira kanakyensis]|uniref:hypothetical protein n=1 Tax=Leptospira kanakyensis TaxID=2484968 RepID=UPI00223D314C|nr:hypothetical protein [Leptospira kanakyensis]MCW7470564.1 hypothetical protein [Leptospira kanakyensis]
MKKIITSYGLINSIKWNGEWFSDHKKRFSRIILPQQITENETSKGLDIESIRIRNCSFLKLHIEDSYLFDTSSFVMNLDSKFLILDKPEFKDIGFLWAFKEGKIAFIKYFTLEELSKLSKN